MGAKRSGRSEPSWPSALVKKWLNITPSVHEFSEDEIEAESEEDEYGEIIGRGLACGSQNAPRFSAVFPSQELGRQSSTCLRRKSETLCMHYTTKKELRVVICTWNVAGKSPCDDLEISSWLSTEEPADIYIIGFQEVVPLNAGNVLGTEDTRPILQWESIIRAALSKTLESESKCKCYMPPSPLTRSSSLDDPYLDSTCRPGNSSNSTCSASPPKARSRQVAMEHYQDVSPQNSSRRSWLKRTCHDSGNLELIWDESMTPKFFNSVHADPGNLAENEDFLGEDTLERTDDEDDGKGGDVTYARIVSKQMVGIYVSVWMSKRLRRHVNNLNVYPVGVGLLGYMGNKGSVSVSMSVYQTRMCFVCSHLSSGHKEGDQQKRNADVHDILHRTRFSSLLDASQILKIPSHDRIFWFGDLNYRIDMPDAKIKALISRKEWGNLIKKDQLHKEMQAGSIFDGWSEGSIHFPPTYKYLVNSNRYYHKKSKDGEKKRSPAWCDRILWLGDGIKQLSYQRAELDLSDHRPVSSIFLVEVEAFDQRKLRRALSVTNAR